MSFLNRTTRKLAFAVATALAGATMLVGVAAAQSPPTPPSRFVGSVTVNGAPAAAGTLIEARIGSTTCGATTVFMAGGQARYALDSPALEPTSNPNCGVDGSVVTFYVGGQQASQTGSWRNYQLNTVDLTVVPAAASPTPTRTPAPPVAGTTSASNETSAPMLELLLVAAALGLGGVAVAARARKS